MMYILAVAALLVATSCGASNNLTTEQRSTIQTLREKLEDIVQPTSPVGLLQLLMRLQRMCMQAPEGCSCEDWVDGCCAAAIGEACNRDCGLEAPQYNCGEGLLCSEDLLCVAKPTALPSPAPSRAPTVAPSREPTVSPSQRPTRTPTYDPTHSPTRPPTHVPTSSTAVSGVCKPTTAVDDPEMIIFCNTESMSNKYLCPEIAAVDSPTESGFTDCEWVEATGPGWCIPTSSEHDYMWENCGARAADDCQREQESPECVWYPGFDSWEDMQLVAAMMG